MQDSVDFDAKKKALFECLESAEKKLQGSSLEQSRHDYNLQPYRQQQQQRKRNREEIVEKYKHRDSLFKRPDLPITKCLRSRQKPEYEKNPNKWKKYSLDDVSDTSDRMNTSAAFSFLKEIEDRRQDESHMDEDDADGSSQKIVFKKSIKLKPKSDEIDPQLNAKKIQGLKIIMPEYVVGERKQKPKKDRKPKDQSTSKGNLRLSHLNNEDDDDDET